LAKKTVTGFILLCKKKKRIEKQKAHRKWHTLTTMLNFMCS